MSEFESRVFQGLENCGIEFKNESSLVFGAAVSGGADSIALLISLSSILKEYKYPLKVITVNHNIRPESESGGDAEYVKSLCEKLQASGFDVSCTVVEIAKGQVSETANVRGQGIEDAARFLRYEAFVQFIKENSLDCLCLAHNQNDQLETLLMRFIQGSGSDAGTGIAAVRGKYIRPLLEIERNDIEKYLTEKNIVWRTDSTNSDTNYLRNKIRHILIPVLNKDFCGWKKGVLNGSKKAAVENKALEEIVETAKYSVSDDNVSMELKSFTSYSDAVKIRLLTRFINLMGITKRIPYAFLQDSILAIENSRSDSFVKTFDSIQILIKKDFLLVKKYAKTQTDLVFFDIIEENGKYLFPFGELDVLLNDNGYAQILSNDSIVINEIKVPFCVRNIQLNDEVEQADGKLKSLVDVFSDWHVKEEHKCLIPVFQLLDGKNQPVKAVLGSLFGYKDWIVK